MSDMIADANEAKLAQSEEVNLPPEIEKIQELITRAEERVLFPDSHGVKARICGKERELKPLPIKYAKRLSSKLQAIFKLSNSQKKEDQQKWAEEADTMIADGLTGCLVDMAEFYKLEISKEAIEAEMSLSEVKAIVAMQAEINDEDDFLLSSLQAILGIISAASLAAKNVRNTADTTKYRRLLERTRDLLKNGEQIL